MRFLFFDAAGTILFERNDAESANVTHEEMSLQVLFPYADHKVVLRGMRIGYEDSLGVFQVYEIRKVKTYEPDHYQEITAEHICISELTDEFFADAEWTDITASAALSELLTGTLWAVGTSAVSNTSSANIANGNVWSDIRTIEKSWNVRILPRVTVNSTGITGRYLDIIGTEGTWRGLRLSLDKNADEVGVTWDDSRLKTALYAFGKSVEQTIAGEKVMKPITFADVEWTATAGHPAKPLGQEYLEDTAATAAYGRNGRARFAYYQNGDISDPEILLEKTWESLQTLNHPDVTVDCLVSDLYRLGYVDVPLRLYDIALVEIRPTGAVITKQIVQYSEDLLNPTQSRLCIGTYIPNIIYINRETEKAAGGGGGGGGGQTKAEYKRNEFETAIQYNEYQISLRATQYDLNQTNANVANAQSQITVTQTGIRSLCTGTGAQLNDNGTLKVDANGNPIFTTTGSGLYSKIEQNANAINLRVVKGDVATQLSVEVGNVTISGGNLKVDGYVEASSSYAGTLYGGAVSVTGNIAGGGTVSGAEAYFPTGTGTFNLVDAATVDTTALTVGGTSATWQSQTVVTSVTITLPSVTLGAEHQFTYAISGDTSNLGKAKGCLVTSKSNGSRSVSTATIHYLGSANT
jgi:phage minor structural protein